MTGRKFHISNQMISAFAIIFLGLAVVAILIANAIQSAEISALKDQVADLEAAQLEMVTLFDRMIETDKNLLDAVMTNAESIEKISGATTANSESIFVLLQMVNDHEAFNRTTIAQIYQAHIIPLRAFHMEDQ